jgi:hypothetical protein
MDFGNALDGKEPLIVIASNRGPFSFRQRRTG